MKKAFILVVVLLAVFVGCNTGSSAEITQGFNLQTLSDEFYIAVTTGKAMEIISEYVFRSL